MSTFLAFLVAEQVLIVIPCLLFCLHYTIAANWWRSPAGINLFGVSACLGVVFALNVSAYLLGGYAALFVVTPIVFGAIGAFMWQRYVLFVRAQGCSWRNVGRLLRIRFRQVTRQENR